MSFDLEVTHPIEVLKLLDTMKETWNVRLTPHSVPLSSNACIFCKGKAVIQPFLAYDGPIFLDENVFIGPHCFLRGPLYIGKNTSIGPYCEIKRSVIMNDTFVTHQNIIPDSVIGSNVWLAGGVMVTNIRLDKQSVKMTCNGIEKSADRFGLFIEDNSTLGVRVTVMPGTYVRAGTTVFGPSTIKGVV